MVQAGGASESFGYTKNYTIDGSGNWQVGGGSSGSGTGGASGSGWTTASYSGSTPALTDLPAFPTAAAGPSTNLLSGTDTQSGSNDTSYSFQTYAAFNGIDWSETGEKIATGSGSTTDSFSASASGLTFSPPSETGPYMNGVTVPGGSASVTGTSSTSYNYRQYAYLDDNGVWQAAATPASDVTNGVDYFGASGTTNWSLSGSGPVGTYQFGTGYVSGVYGANSGSGTTNASGSGSDTYNYQELFSYSPATNQWTPTGGSGSASGSGSATFGYSAGGDLTDTGPWGPWDEAYTGVERMMVGMGDAANDWSGTVAASGTATVSYGYSTQSNFTPGTGTASGWTSTGTASASASGGYSTSFDAGSPFANNYSGGAGNSATLSGTVTGSGSDWGTYNYNQTNALSSDGTWSVSSGSGSTSGGASANWSYAGNDGTWSYSGDGTTLSGSVSESGGETYNLNYSGQASVSSGEWVQTGSGVGAGNASATANFSYSYSGDASGSGGGSGSYNDPLDVTLSGGNWSLAGEGTVSPSNTATTPPSDAAFTAVIDNVVNTPEGGYVVDVPANPYDAGDPWNLPSPAGPGVVAAIMSDWVDPQATPSPASVLDQTAPVSSLPSLATSASLVDAIWGMGSVAVAGYDGNNSAFATEYVVSMPQTLIAAGNNPLSLPTFTSETMPSAGGVFGRINVANMAPVTESSNIVGEGFRGVTAGTNVPNTGSKGPDPSTNPVTNVVKPTGGGCFAAGTLIPMADGTMKPIEQVEVGDRVKSASERDPEGPISSGGVAEVFRHQPQGLMEVGVNGSVIRCTGNHPFYVRGRGFIPAEQLKSGDELRRQRRLERRRCRYRQRN